MTVRQMMLAVLAFALLLGWVAAWEGIRVERRRVRAQAIAESYPDIWGTYGSLQEALEESERIRQTAHFWAVPWEINDYIFTTGFGVLLIMGTMGLGRSVVKVLSIRVRRATRHDRLAR